MAMRCFGRARFAGIAALPLLASLRGAVDLAPALRAGDFLRAEVFRADALDAVRALAPARATGFFDFFLSLFFAIPALPVRSNKASTDGPCRHCEERMRRSNPEHTSNSGLLRFARNDAEISMQPEHAVDGAKLGGLDQLGV